MHPGIDSSDLKKKKNECFKIGPFSVEVHSDYQTMEDV